MYMPSFTHTQFAAGLSARAGTAHQRQSRFPAGLRLRRGPALRQSRLVHPGDGQPDRRQRRAWTRPTSATPTRSSSSARTRSGASTPTTRRPSKIPWNTTPAFGWPQISSTIAPAFAPPLTHIESGLGQIVGGAGAYLFWNDMLYADFTAYKGLPVGASAGARRRQFDDRRRHQRRPLLARRARAALGTALPGGRHVRHVLRRSRPAASTDSAPTTISTSASTRNTSMTATNTASRSS